MPNNRFAEILRYAIPLSNRGFANTEGYVISLWKQSVPWLSIDFVFQVLLPEPDEDGSLYLSDSFAVDVLPFKC